jgi:DNA-directed RNA polymerase specialized sigma subunit
LIKGDLGADKVRAVEREYAKVTSQINDLENKAGKTSFFNKISDKLNITKENIKTALGTIGIAVGTFLEDHL